MNYLLLYSAEVDVSAIASYSYSPSPVFELTDHFYVNAGRCSSCHGEAQGGEVARSPGRKAQQEPCNW